MTKDSVKLGSVRPALTDAADAKGPVTPLPPAVMAVIQTAETAVAEAIARSRTFVAQPVPPYALTDLWLDSTGLIKRCTTARATGSYNAADWTLWAVKADYIVANVALSSPVVTGGSFTGTTFATGSGAATYTVLSSPTTLSPGGLSFKDGGYVRGAVYGDATNGGVVLACTASDFASLTAKVSVSPAHTGVGQVGGVVLSAYDEYAAAGFDISWGWETISAAGQTPALVVPGKIVASGQITANGGLVAYGNSATVPTIALRNSNDDGPGFRMLSADGTKSAALRITNAGTFQKSVNGGAWTAV